MPVKNSSPRFSKHTFDFIKKASRQKRADWLDRNRSAYEEHVLNPLFELSSRLKAEIGAIAPAYHFPQRGIGRLKRSTYGAQKYGVLFRDYISYSVSRPAKSRFDHNPNLFFMIYPEDPDGDEVLVAGGLYMPSSRQLRAIREAIARDATPFDRLFASKAFAASFPHGFSDERTATRPPRGFDPAHPRMKWLKYQGYFVWKSYKKREFSSAAFPDRVARDWKQILRLNELLEQALNSSAWGAAGRVNSVREKKTPLASRLEEIEAPQRKMDF